MAGCVGRRLDDEQLEVARLYPCALPASAVEALWAWLDTRRWGEGDELRSLAGVVALASDRLATLAIACNREEDSDATVLAAASLAWWAAGVSHTATVLAERLSTVYDPAEDDHRRRATGEGGRRLAALSQQTREGRVRDGLDVLLPTGLP